MALDQVTPLPDSLVAALRAVPMRAEKVWPDGADAEVPDYPALAAAAREWITKQLPGPAAYVPFYARSWQNGYDSAVAEVARRLSL